MSKVGSSIRARVPYVPIHKRKKLHLPGDGKIILWVIVNIENWRPEKPMPRVILPPPMGQPMLPDVPNWAWHEYGMRVGFWRYLEALQSRRLKATVALNGSACEVYPEACEAARDAGWEFIGHGYVQTPMHTVDDEREVIARTMQAITALTGRAPRGWESPGLTETDETVDLLAEAGIEYVANWVLDDQPVPVNTRAGSMTALPYPVEINDVVMSAVQLQPSDEIWRRGRDQFDRLYQESSDSVRVMSISIHPFLTGVPHRIKYLEQLLDYILGHEGVVPMTGAEMLDWYRAQHGQPAAV
ncbi:polysaccharide deacetylase family protein [Castellaniella sp.]|uniref:polysaccharide deacetylase family protein n=1 Tax=Castellaniella sp. TaxID=1955812 RepID=UPI003560B867